MLLVLNIGDLLRKCLFYLLVMQSYYTYSEQIQNMWRKIAILYVLIRTQIMKNIAFCVVLTCFNCNLMKLKTSFIFYFFDIQSSYRVYVTFCVKATAEIAIDEIIYFLLLFVITWLITYR